jgi:hypothetical protein
LLDTRFAGDVDDELSALASPGANAKRVVLRGRDLVVNAIARFRLGDVTQLFPACVAPRRAGP